MSGADDGTWEDGAIIIRVSTGEQDEANQVPDLEKLCVEHRVRIKKRFELHDRSAYKGEQEECQEEALRLARRSSSWGCGRLTAWSAVARRPRYGSSGGSGKLVAGFSPQKNRG